MPASLQGKLVVAVSSRALFDLEEEHALFQARGPDAFAALQLERLDRVARPGVAAPLVRKLLRFNTPEAQRVEVVILSRNDPVSGMRAFRSAAAAGLPIERGVFTSGAEPFRYLQPLLAHLFLSADENDIRAALDAGVPAARVFPRSFDAATRHPGEVRIAFDGDAVLFSDEAEQVFQAGGLDDFQRHEAERAATALAPGPFHPFLVALHALRRAAGTAAPMRIRTALVTARSAPAHERAIRTLMEWQIGVDEAMFLGGLAKGPFLQEFEPDFFFDDQLRHCESASQVGPAGHVLAGVVNRRG